MDVQRSDLVVVGAGIVGLGHAVEAVRRGLTVTIVDRESEVVGASVRNFGHGCVTGQTGKARELAEESRRRWLQLAEVAGFWAQPTGTVVLARADDELRVVRELAGGAGGDGVQLLDAQQARARSGSRSDEVVGGAFLERDLRVDPREAVPALAAWLARQPGVTFLWSTFVHSAGAGRVHTSRGELAADRVVLCVGHDLGWLVPQIGEEHQVRRCRLHMLRIAPPSGMRIEPGILSGLSLLRYSAFSRQPSAALVRDRIARERPELLELGVNLMLTQRPDGSLLIGDTHHYGDSVTPFAAEQVDELILTETARLLGVESLAVLERWAGVYASAPEEFLVRDLDETTTLVAVTTGIGMTTGLGLAAEVLAQRLR